MRSSLTSSAEIANINPVNSKVSNRQELKILVLQSLPILSRRANWKYVEFWTSDDSKFCLKSNIFYSCKESEEAVLKYRKEAGPNAVSAVVNEVISSQASVTASKPFDDLHGKLDFNCCFGVPIVHSEETLGVLLFFGDSLPDNLYSFCLYCNGLIASGLPSSTHNVMFYPNENQQVKAERMYAIFNILSGSGVFNRIHIYEDVDWWFNMNIPKEYFNAFNDEEIASHIHCFLAAKKLGQAMDNNEFIYVNNDTANSQGVVCKKFILCPATFADSVHVEQKIDDFLRNKPENHGVIVKYLISGGTSYPNGKHRLSIYTAEVSPFPNTVAVEEPGKCNVKEIACEAFIEHSSEATLKIYQDFLSRASLKLRPVYTVEPTTEDKITPVRIILRHADKSSYLQRCTEVLRLTKIPCRSKKIESFSNGAVVYSFDLDTTDIEKVNLFVYCIQMITTVGGGSLRNSFLDGTFGVEEFAYIYAVRKFIYYFNQPSEELKKISEMFPRESIQYQKLIRLQSKLFREAITRARTLQCIMDNIVLIKQIFADFALCATRKPVFNEALKKQIDKACVGDDIDIHILTSFLNFNASILKTNFWGKSKAALSFTLDPIAFISEAGFEQSPYCIFWVVGAEFQGFHIRVRDISRGGIRVIKSPNHSAFEKNINGQFIESYDLAYTQHKKNKDIPEFGSKGTVLLNEMFQQSTKISFQKYISGLMDLLVITPEDNIIDHYKKEEILFLGPDENTADLMEWAALYAQRRKYPYWKAFTTGKPAYLGGIPHDTYGMTTRGVHTYVLNCLRKLGMKEEEVTKCQTGGPDGDLGSNEILISKDKTIAIIDGSGVLYDKDGIHRPTLMALAHKRQMIDQFDVSKLGKTGFRVLVTENNITLPNGEVVESGLTFRNTFHLHSLFTADLFVPCGGRPQSIQSNNVHQLFDEKNKPKFKVIVEGANLFFTQDARLELEKAGVVLYKDSSANKGGVTSSSLEVLAALSMTDEEHKEHMQVRQDTIPPFYQKYVVDIQNKIALNSQLEFNAIWAEHDRTKLPRCVLSDKISKKINDLNDACLKSSLFENVELRKKVLGLCLPKSLQQLLSIDVILSRLPKSYCSALFNSYIASNYVYKYGLDTNEFGLFEFIDTLMQTEVKFEEDK